MFADVNIARRDLPLARLRHIVLLFHCLVALARAGFGSSATGVGAWRV
jgi:hypothetical protein